MDLFNLFDLFGIPFEKKTKNKNKNNDKNNNNKKHP